MLARKNMRKTQVIAMYEWCYVIKSRNDACQYYCNILKKNKLHGLRASCNYSYDAIRSVENEK